MMLMLLLFSVVAAVAQAREIRNLNHEDTMALLEEWGKFSNKSCNCSFPFPSPLSDVITVQTSDLVHVYGDGFKAKKFDGFALETMTRELISEEFPEASPLQQAYVSPFI